MKYHNKYFLKNIFLINTLQSTKFISSITFIQIFVEISKIAFSIALAFSIKIKFQKREFEEHCIKQVSNNTHTGQCCRIILYI